MQERASKENNLARYTISGPCRIRKYVRHCILLNSLQNFIRDIKEGWSQISRPKLSPLSTYILENRIRRASGPVFSPILLNILSDSVLPYLAIYPKLGYFWPKFATNIFFWLLGLFGYFWKFGKNWFCLYFFVIWCKYFGFSKVLWCRSFGVFYNLASFCSNFLATLIRVVYNITYFLQLEEISQESYIDRVRLNHQT